MHYSWIVTALWKKLIEYRQMFVVNLAYIYSKVFTKSQIFLSNFYNIYNILKCCYTQRLLTQTCDCYYKLIN